MPSPSKLAGFFVGLLIAACAQATDNSGLGGKYYLQDAREMASILQLEEDHFFALSLSYGARDQLTTGRWKLEGETLTLTSEPRSAPEFRVMAEEELRLKRPAEPGTWIAVVGVPHTAPLANIEVRFVGSKGEAGQATTLANGDAILTPKNPKQRWIKAGLRRAGTNDEWQWFPVPGTRADERIAAFAVDDPSYLYPAAFSTLQLQRKGDTLVIQGDANQPAMVYSR